jgi:tetratricopeptide (TPR) repeat protein
LGSYFEKGDITMVKPVPCKKLLVIVAYSLMLAFLSTSGVYGQERGLGQAKDHNQRGMEYFNKGFYDHTPKEQVDEGERNYGLAIKEFKAAISKDPFFPDAHRNLARLYFLKKNFDGAALLYKRVTELDPGDLESYVHLSLALIELKRFDEAVQALENAKIQTSDPKVLEKLDTYISKVRAHQAKEVN